MAGGLTKGPSHAKGGIKMKVKSTGQNIEVEGGEGIINKHVMSSKKKISYKGKKATPCEIASDLNQQTGNGVKFDCAETEFTDMTPTDPSTGFDKGGEITEIIHEQTTPHSIEIDAIEEIADVSLFAKGGDIKYFNEWSESNPYSIKIYDKDGDSQSTDWLDLNGVLSFKRKYPNKEIVVLKSDDGIYLDEDDRFAKGGKVQIPKLPTKSYVDTLFSDETQWQRNEKGNESVRTQVLNDIEENRRNFGSYSSGRRIIKKFVKGEFTILYINEDGEEELWSRGATFGAKENKWSELKNKFKKLYEQGLEVISVDQIVYVYISDDFETLWYADNREEYSIRLWDNPKFIKEPIVEEKVTPNPYSELASLEQIYYVEVIKDREKYRAGESDVELIEDKLTYSQAEELKEKINKENPNWVVFIDTKENFAKGGKTKESVGDKIKILMEEGYPHRQAVAIALSMKERGKYNMGGQVQTGGDCYERAGKMAMEVNASNKLDIRNCDFKPMMEAENIEVKDGFIHPTGKFYLVQAQVQHQALDDIVFGHSFLEDDEYVYDFSNGVCKVLPKSVYYYLGRIKTKKPYYYKYTPEQAIRKMIDTGHYGSWDLKTDSGL